MRGAALSYLLMTPARLDKKAAVIRSAEQCAVKKRLEHPPVFNVTTSTVEIAAA